MFRMSGAHEDFSRFVSINLTNDCNLRCIYCYEDNKNKDSMTFNTAKKIIDGEIKFVNNSEYYKELNIELFGGEPFIEFEMIKKIVSYVKQKNNRKKINILITTNGTLIHGEIQDWLEKNKDFINCCLSLDGTSEMHNLNRSSSFEMIDIDFFRKTFPNKKVKMTVSTKTLPLLSKGVIYCHDLGFKVSCNLAYGIDWTSSDNKELLKRELSLLSDYYLNHPDIEPCDMLGEPIRTRKEHTMFCRKWCGVGTHTCSYDTYGNSYACQFFMPLSIGNEKAKQANSIIFEDYFPLEYIDVKCRNCVYEPSCPTCCASNYKLNGNPYHRDLSMCELYKIIIDARCDFIANYWAKGYLKFDKTSEVETIRSIIKIVKSNEELNCL